MSIDRHLFRARLVVYNTGLSFLKKKNPEKKVNILQNNECFSATHAKVLPCLELILFYLRIVNIYLLSLRLIIRSSIFMKSINSYIALSNYIITICINHASILTIQVLLKSDNRNKCRT